MQTRSIDLCENLDTRRAILPIKLKDIDSKTEELARENYPRTGDSTAATLVVFHGRDRVTSTSGAILVHEQAS
jgi:hypothetical protein